MQETQVSSLGWEGPLEKGIATHSNVLAWEIPRTEKPGGHSLWGHKESDMMQWKNNNKWVKLSTFKCLKKRFFFPPVLTVYSCLLYVNSSVGFFFFNCISLYCFLYVLRNFTLWHRYFSHFMVSVLGLLMVFCPMDVFIHFYGVDIINLFVTSGLWRMVMSNVDSSEGKYEKAC